MDKVAMLCDNYDWKLPSAKIEFDLSGKVGLPDSGAAPVGRLWPPEQGHQQHVPMVLLTMHTAGTSHVSLSRELIIGAVSNLDWWHGVGRWCHGQFTSS